jgi:hypothetical protein
LATAKWNDGEEGYRILDEQVAQTAENGSIAKNIMTQDHV